MIDTPAMKAVHNAHTKHWRRLERAAPDRLVQFRVSLTTTKSDAELEQLVHALSDVTSPSYGQYLRSPEALAAHWAPHATATQAIEQLAATIQSLDARANDLRDLWTLRMRADDAESLFATELYEFAHHRVSGLTVVRPGQQYALPTSLASHVVFVDGLESFPTEMQAQYMAQNRDPFTINHDISNTNNQNVVTPELIRDQYEIPHNATARKSGPHNQLVIGTFLREFYTESDLRAFLATYDAAFAASAVLPTTHGDCVAGRKESIATRATGEASLDIQVAAAIARSDDVAMFCYTGLRDDSRPESADNQEPFLTFLHDVNALVPPPAVVSISYTDDECSVPVAYALAVNRELMKAALRGVTVVISAGDAGSLGSHLAGFCGGTTCGRLRANFPASSPFVTAVGATTIDTRSRSTNDGGRTYREVVTSTADGALITSGGGFSDLFSRPLYQDAAVASYVATAHAAGLTPLQFNASGRAYPDITAVGHAFPVVENGQMYPTDGTSVSAPLVAAIVTLVNAERLAVSKPALGFLNPLLYALYTECPHVFTDVTDGNTKCGTPDMGCCPTGHFATTGWDAASGVGTLRFSAFVRDLDTCIARIQATERPLLPHTSLFAASDLFATAAQRSMHELLLSVAFVAGVALVGMLVALRSSVFAAAADRVKRNVREPAREYLLAHDPSRV